MVAFIVGHGRLLDVLQERIPEKRWRTPMGRSPSEQAAFLAANPVPEGRRGYVFTTEPANWSQASQAGWHVLWCEPGEIPYGTMPLGEKALSHSLQDMARRFWNVDIADRRLVGDIMLGKAADLAACLSITSVTGGVSKTTTSKRTAERAAENGVRTLLVDANQRQSSIRSFFDPMKRMEVNTICDWRQGEKPQKGANPGKLFKVRYDLCFAPPSGMTVEWDHYAEYITQARRVWDLVIVDFDRVSVADFYEPDTAASQLIAPSCKSGDPVLFIVKAGRQTQGDAISLLSRLPELGMPRECVAVKDTIPEGMDSYHRIDYSKWATYLGGEHQTPQAGARIAAGESNWPDPELDHTRELLLDWVMPDAGFDPDRYPLPRQHRRKGLFR